MPGAGKTEFFVNQALKLLTNKKPSTNLIYVAPTVRLLKEALKRITQHPRFHEEMANSITMVATPERLTKVNLCRTFDERPVKVISHLLGLGECGLVFDNHPVLEIGKGHILMTTHECFVQVPNKDKTGRSFEVLRRSDVIFDEARQCVISSHTSRDLTPYDLALMKKHGIFKFNIPPVPVLKADVESGIKGQTRYVYELSEAADDFDLLTAFNTSRLRNIPASVRRLQKEVTMLSDEGRAGVFFMTAVDLYDHKKTKKILREGESILIGKDKKVALEPLSGVVTTTLLRPTSLFNNYRTVTLLSAFFKDSQMFHLLSQDGHSFNDLMAENPPELASVIERDRKLRNQLPKRLMVAPLLKFPREKESDKTFRQTLTAGLLQSGMIIPASVAEEAANELDTRELTLSQALTSLRQGRTISKDKKIQARLEKFCVPPLWTLISESARVVRQLRDKGLLPLPKDVGQKADCLLIINVKSRYWYDVSATATIRELYAHGRFGVHEEDENDGETERDGGAVDKTALSDSCPKIWRDRLASILYMRSPDAVFTMAPSTKLHGLNNYSGLSAFAHLAALNPDPTMITLYRAVLGEGYKIDMDHSIENLVQTLYRTSLRRVDCKDKVLMIIPYRYQAEALREKIGCSEFKQVYTPRLTRWIYRKPVDSEVARKNGSKGGRKSAEVRSLGLDTEQKKRYQSLSSQIRRYMKLLKDAPADLRREHWKSRISQLMKEKKNMLEIAQIRKHGNTVN